MKIHTSDKLIAWMTLFSGLTISAVAIYYSVAGLTAIFAAAVVPIVVMGIALEISKLAATVWLKQNWNRAPNFIRIYLLAAILILMLITSMGIFGFLSKAHSDQSLVSGDVQSKIAVYDEKIKIAKENIDANRKALKQLDEAVDQVMARSQDEKGADKAVAIRRGQAKERARILSEITTEQNTIAKLNEERAPIAAEVRKVEAEVGPIKYIANFIYGDNPEANVLEKAVTWVIIIIVIVFDPLAVILLLASQYSFQWFRREEDDLAAMNISAEPGPGVVLRPFTDEEIKALDEAPTSAVWQYPKRANIQEYRVEDADDFLPTYAEITPKDEEPKFDSKPYDTELDEEEILNSVTHSEKEKMAAWKHDHPNDSLKRQRFLLEKGIIKELPWINYLQPKADYTEDQEAAIEAAKWAQEQLDPKQEVSWMEHDDQGNQIKKTKDSYQQNAEQNERTIWQRIQDAKQ